MAPFAASERSRRLRPRWKFDAKLAAATAVVAVFALHGSPARADGEADARRLFLEGRTLRSEERCADAIAVFQKARDLYPTGLGSLRNIAECEEHLGHLAASRRAWTELGQALRATNDPRYAGWAHDVDAADVRLAPKVGRLDVVVGSDGSGNGTPTARVTVNGAPWDRSKWGTPVDVDPGRYVVRLEDGSTPDVRRLDIAAGEEQRVDLGQRAAAPAAAVTPVPPPPGARHHGDGLQTAAWVAFGLGGAGLVGGAISAGVEQSAANDVKQQCASHTGCNRSLQGTVDRGQTAATLVNVFFAVGAAGAATGAVLLLIGGREERTAVLATPGGLAVAGRF